MMAKQPTKSRTPVAEWVAAALGGALTLGVIGYSIFDGVTAGDDHPSLAVVTEAVQRSGEGYLVPIVITNDSHATAAAVEVRGVLNAGDTVVEERRVVITYVPGKGEARGGLMFERNPANFRLRVSPEGYEEP
jgi:uncharacterized protein (TIGR02588 family)